MEKTSSVYIRVVKTMFSECFCAQRNTAQKGRGIIEVLLLANLRLPDEGRKHGEAAGDCFCFFKVIIHYRASLIGSESVD